MALLPFATEATNVCRRVRTARQVSVSCDYEAAIQKPIQSTYSLPLHFYCLLKFNPVFQQAISVARQI